MIWRIQYIYPTARIQAMVRYDDIGVRGRGEVQDSEQVVNLVGCWFLPILLVA